MRHERLITCKRRTSNIEHKTIKKQRKSRRSQIVSSKFSLFPSGIFPAEKDSEGLKELKKMKMKIYLIVMSIEGYLKKLTNKSMHFGGGKESPIYDVKGKLENHNTDGKFNKNFVDDLVEKIVKLRVLALKEVEDVKEKKTFNQRIDYAKEKLKEVNGLLKRWHKKHGEFLEKQNQLVINKDPLVLDFRRVNHQLTDDQSRQILLELKQFWDDSGKKDAGKMMRRALEIFREAGQRCFQEDLKHSKLKEVEYIRKLEEEKTKKEEELLKNQKASDLLSSEFDKARNNGGEQEIPDDNCLNQYQDGYSQRGSDHSNSGENKDGYVVHYESDGNNSGENKDGYVVHYGNNDNNSDQCQNDGFDNEGDWNNNFDRNENDEIQDDIDPWNNSDPLNNSDDDWNAKADQDEVEDEQESEKPVERKTSKRPHHNKSPQHKDGDGKESRDSPRPNRGPKRSKSGKLNHSSSLDYNKKLKRKLELKLARYEKKIENLDRAIQFKLDKLNK